MSSGIINIGVTAAIAAGKAILRGFGQLDRVNIFQKSTNEFVSDIDHKAEEIIFSTIEKSYPSHTIISEEYGTKPGNDTEWIIDPLDGTNNFIHGFPLFAISIAVRIRDSLEYAIIYNPLSNELYTANKGHGAQLNNKRIRVSKKQQLAKCLVATECPNNSQEIIVQHLEKSKIMMSQTVGIRRTGSAALNLAYVASGKLDGFWQSKINIWDMAAGILLVKEAGGIVYDFKGSDKYFDSNNIVAANPKIAKNILEIVKN